MVDGPYLIGSVLYNDDDKIAEFVRTMCPHLINTTWDKFRALGVVRRAAIVGGVVFHNYRERAHDIEISAAFSTSAWCLPQTAKQICDYPINQLGCKRITARTARKNRKARGFLERLGFKVEGVARRALDGRQDMILYGLLIEDMTWKRRA